MGRVQGPSELLAVLISLMRCLFLLRLAEVVTLESVFQQSFENRSIAKFCTNLADARC